LTSNDNNKEECKHSNEFDEDINNNKLENIFFELGYHQRLDIFLKLADKNSKISALSKELDLPMPEIHRNINRLQNVKLVKKDKEGLLHLSSFGRAISKQISSFNFLINNLEYFNTHDFGDLPDRFVQSIGTLENCKFSKGLTNVLEIWKELIENTNEYFYAIIPQFGGSLNELAFTKFIEKSIKLKLIVPTDTIVTKKYIELKAKYNIDEFFYKKIFERRMADNVKVAILINEKQAIVDLPFENGETDFNNLFYGNDPLFHEWCNDYFIYRWNSSKMFNESKLRIDK
jgi:predicted transcriptional regulator